MNDQLSVGIGADIYTFAIFWGSGQSVTKFNSSGGPGLPPPGTRMEVNGGDTAAGFNVSLLYTPLRNGDGKPLANVALIYRSQATLHLDGNLLAMVVLSPMPRRLWCCRKSSPAESHWPTAIALMNGNWS